MDKPVSPRRWRLGPWPLSLWSLAVYAAILAAMAAAGFAGQSADVSSWPIYTGEDALQGSYPFFWLVYVWLPLILRDAYVARKRGNRFMADFWWQWLVLTAFSLAAYHWIFAWI